MGRRRSQGNPFVSLLRNRTKSGLGGGKEREGAPPVFLLGSESLSKVRAPARPTKSSSTAPLFVHVFNPGCGAYGSYPYWLPVGALSCPYKVVHRRAPVGLCCRWASLSGQAISRVPICRHFSMSCAIDGQCCWEAPLRARPSVAFLVGCAVEGHCRLARPRRECPSVAFAP